MYKQNYFNIGERVLVKHFYTPEGDRLDEYYDKRKEDLGKEGIITTIWAEDSDGGYVYSVDGCVWCFNYYELESMEDDKYFGELLKQEKREFVYPMTLGV